jgi:hypothetical protein
VETFYAETGTPIAAFHPRFIVEHSIAACAFDNVPPQLSLDLVKDAVENLVIRDRPGGRDSQSLPRRSPEDEKPAPSPPSTGARDVYEDVEQLLKAR